MIITDIAMERVTTPLRTPFITALRRVESVEEIVVALHTDKGILGLGAAPATRAITGEDLDSIERTITHTICPLLLHQPFELSVLLQTLHGCCEGDSSAKAAVDMALYDLAANAASLPLYAYLGGAYSPFRTAVTISLKSPEAMAVDAKEAITRGLDILKVKVGGGDGDDIERIRAVRYAAPEAAILIDANQAWDVGESLFVIKAVENLDIELIEQPAAADIEGLRRVTAKSPIPILADESVFTLEDARRVIETEAADMVNIKLMKCGGISKAIEIIGYCRKNGVKCMMGSMLEGPVSITAAAHLVMAFKESFPYVDLDSPLLYRAPPKESFLQFSGNRLEIRSG